MRAVCMRAVRTGRPMADVKGLRRSMTTELAKIRLTAIVSPSHAAPLVQGQPL